MVNFHSSFDPNVKSLQQLKGFRNCSFRLFLFQKGFWRDVAEKAWELSFVVTMLLNYDVDLCHLVRKQGTLILDEQGNIKH
jgi:hypothetical protein